MATAELTPEGACGECGNTNLTHAVDYTRYRDVTKEGGAWRVRSSCGANPPTGDERFFCTRCGTYFEMPDGLPD